MRNIITLLLLIFLMSCGSTVTTENTPPKVINHVLPESVFGEWFDPAGSKQYNGVLVHPNFIEYNYTAFMYNKINKIDDRQYEFSAKNNQGQIVSFQLQVIDENTITLKRGHIPNTTYMKKQLPPGAEQISLEQVPSEIKNSWYTTDGQSTSEFEISDGQFSFKGENYNVEEIMYIQEPKLNLNQYRFVVSNNQKSWLFYFKHWSDDYVQIGYNSKKGAIYKSNKSFSVSPSSLPTTVFGEWYNPSGNSEYNGVLIQPNFIEYNYTAFMFENIDKLNDTDYQFSARTQDRILTGTLSVLNESTINLKRGNADIITYIKKELPYASTPVNQAEVPDFIKGSWYTVDAAKTVKFTITDTEFNYRGEEYNVDEIIYIDGPKIEQYRFIVSKDENTHMFYFKDWSKNRIRIGFNGRKGGFYQKD